MRKVNSVKRALIEAHIIPYYVGMGYGYENRFFIKSYWSEQHVSDVIKTVHYDSGSTWMQFNGNY